MSKSISKPMSWQAYLDLPTKMDRVTFLNSLSAETSGLSLRFVKDILNLELHFEEKIALLRTIQHKDEVMFEDFVTRQLLNWPQDLAVAALKCWATESRHQLWYRIPGLVSNSHTSQRLSYTIVDFALVTGGHTVIDHVLSMSNFTELSPAFQALCLLQATYWNRPSPMFAEAANRQLEYLHQSGHPEQKVLPSALSYVARFHPQTLHALAGQLPVNNPWRDLIRDISAQLETKDMDLVVQKALQQKNKNLAAIWPPAWQRHQLSVSTIAQAFSALDQLPDAEKRTFNFATFFLGCSHEVLEDALLTQKDDAHLLKYLGNLHHLIRHPYSERLAAKLTSQEPDQLKSEQQAWLKGKTQYSFECSDQAFDEQESQQLASFYEFFQIMHQGNEKKRSSTSSKQAGPKDSNNPWHMLSQAWQNPEKSQLETLAQSARKGQGIYQICYLKTLARFKGSDEAALKMLDFTRSQDEDILRHVIQALHAIGTPRALQEMVAAITRPNLTHELQVEIVQLLSQHDLQQLQAEIRSAISDLIPPPNTNSTPYDIREMLSELLVPPASSTDESLKNAMANNHSEYNEKALDQVLQAKITHYQFLSSEVKRALRTSLFFDMQVTGSEAVSSMDLSPVVDMQYKALELLFREMFESPCHKIIQSGVPQRKLDVVGYARPVMKAMDDFESYIANHPIIRDIPFFSKFKLRKMLRAICQYRPGRRFTLDGLKAFGLFFLVFSRSNCKYGLQNVLPLGLQSDEELFQFCKTLHTMQDVRNRAAHEGFHPDASNNLEGIWQTTASIIAVAAKASNTSIPQSKAS